MKIQLNDKDIIKFISDFREEYNNLSLNFKSLEDVTDNVVTYLNSMQLNEEFIGSLLYKEFKESLLKRFEAGGEEIIDGVIYVDLFEAQNIYFKYIKPELSNFFIQAPLLNIVTTYLEGCGVKLEHTLNLYTLEDVDQCEAILELNKELYKQFFETLGFYVGSPNHTNLTNSDLNTILDKVKYFRCKENNLYTAELVAKSLFIKYDNYFQDRNAQYLHGVAKLVVSLMEVKSYLENTSQEDIDIEVIKSYFNYSSNMHTLFYSALSDTNTSLLEKPHLNYIKKVLFENPDEVVISTKDFNLFNFDDVIKSFSNFKNKYLNFIITGEMSLSYLTDNLNKSNLLCKLALDLIDTDLVQTKKLTDVFKKYITLVTQFRKSKAYSISDSDKLEQDLIRYITDTNISVSTHNIKTIMLNLVPHFKEELTKYDSIVEGLLEDRVNELKFGKSLILKDFSNKSNLIDSFLNSFSAVIYKKFSVSGFVPFEVFIHTLDTTLTVFETTFLGQISTIIHHNRVRPNLLSKEIIDQAYIKFLELCEKLNLYQENIYLTLRDFLTVCCNALREAYSINIPSTIINDYEYTFLKPYDNTSQYVNVDKFNSYLDAQYITDQNLYYAKPVQADIQNEFYKNDIKDWFNLFKIEFENMWKDFEVDFKNQKYNVDKIPNFEKKYSDRCNRKGLKFITPKCKLVTIDYDHSERTLRKLGMIPTVKSYSKEVITLMINEIRSNLSVVGLSPDDCLIVRNYLHDNVRYENILTLQNIIVFEPNIIDKFKNTLQNNNVTPQSKKFLCNTASKVISTYIEDTGFTIKLDRNIKEIVLKDLLEKMKDDIPIEINVGEITDSELDTLFEGVILYFSKPAKGFRFRIPPVELKKFKDDALNIAVLYSESLDIEENDLEESTESVPKNNFDIFYNWLSDFYSYCKEHKAYPELTVILNKFKNTDGVLRINISTNFNIATIHEVANTISLDKPLSLSVFNDVKNSILNLKP